MASQWKWNWTNWNTLGANGPPLTVAGCVTFDGVALNCTETSEDYCKNPRLIGEKLIARLTLSNFVSHTYVVLKSSNPTLKVALIH